MQNHQERESRRSFHEQVLYDNAATATPAQHYPATMAHQPTSLDNTGRTVPAFPPNLPSSNPYCNYDDFMAKMAQGMDGDINPSYNYGGAFNNSAPGSTFTPPPPPASASASASVPSSAPPFFPFQNQPVPRTAYGIPTDSHPHPPPPPPTFPPPAQQLNPSQKRPFSALQPQDPRPKPSPRVTTFQPTPSLLLAKAELNNLLASKEPCSRSMVVKEWPPGGGRNFNVQVHINNQDEYSVMPEMLADFLSLPKIPLTDPRAKTARTAAPREVPRTDYVEVEVQNGLPSMGMPDMVLNVQLSKELNPKNMEEAWVVYLGTKALDSGLARVKAMIARESSAFAAREEQSRGEPRGDRPTEDRMWPVIQPVGRQGRSRSRTPRPPGPGSRQTQRGPTTPNPGGWDAREFLTPYPSSRTPSRQPSPVIYPRHTVSPLNHAASSISPLATQHPRFDGVTKVEEVYENMGVPGETSQWPSLLHPTAAPKSPGETDDAPWPPENHANPGFGIEAHGLEGSMSGTQGLDIEPLAYQLDTLSGNKSPYDSEGN